MAPMEASTTDTAPGGSSFAARLDRYFGISSRGSSIPTEVRGGAATFLTMAYILFVNPQILGSVAAPGGVKLPFDQLLTVTALVAAVATLAMGIYGRYPFALAAGLGINAFVAFSLVGADRLSWPDAMGVVVAEGLIITVLVLVGFREAVINAIPHDLKLAIGIGIGLFITIIGLVDAGIVIKGQGTVVTIAPKLNTWAIAIFVIGLFGTYAMVARRVRGALLFGILGTTLLATIVNEAKDKKVFPNGSATWPDKIFATPDFSLVGNFSLHFVSALGFWSAVAVVLSVLLSDFFDTAGTVLGLGRRAELVTPDGRLPGMKRVLLVDSLAAAGGGAASASSNTTFIESSAGIGEGARTGLASVITGLLFALLPVHLAAGGDHPQRGDGAGTRDRRGDDVRARAPPRVARSGHRAAGAADDRADADDLQHHQRRRGGLRLLLGADATRRAPRASTDARHQRRLRLVLHPRRRLATAGGPSGTGARARCSPTCSRSARSGAWP